MEIKEVYKKLSAPFTKVGADGVEYPAVKWRVQSGNKCIPYVDVRQVSERLNDVLGMDGWEHTLEETNQKMVICNLTITIGDKQISHSDVGTPAKQEAEKSMASDSLKRAAVHFGVGRYIYDMDPVVVNDPKIRKDPEALTSYINQKHPMRSKLTEVYHWLSDEDKKKLETQFKEIWTLLDN